MEKNTLKTKLEKYMHGQATLAEKKQIDAWLSNGIYTKISLAKNEKRHLHDDILNEVKNYTAYPLFYPKNIELPGKVLNWLKKTFL